MNLYICRGYGIWLNDAMVIIAALNIREARNLLNDWSKTNSIDVSQFDIELAEATEPGIIFALDGDY